VAGSALGYRASPMGEADYQRFSDISFDDFRRMAEDDSLSQYEKVGFPNEYREGKEEAIFADVMSKLPALGKRDRTILDIGPGCSDLPRMMLDLCARQGHTLLFVDSPEMLAHHEDEAFLEKFPARFPDCPDLFERYTEGVDAILAYSVLHYVFPDASVFSFLDRALQLLAPEGSLLIGDIPNVSKRKRLFASETGRRLHREFTGRDEDPEVTFNSPEPTQIDDSVVLALVSRARAAGFQAYVVPQAPDLPMANRREDLLIHRP
jgi:hypothetical protein